jgi:succinate dehydrogenase hydrophobic anchor subunit
MHAIGLADLLAHGHHRVVDADLDVRVRRQREQRREVAGGALPLPYLSAYPAALQSQVRGWLADDKAEAWLIFYVVFALAAGLHGAIGLRNIAGETLGWRGRGIDFCWLALGLLTAAFGIRAAFALYA